MSYDIHSLSPVDNVTHTNDLTDATVCVDPEFSRNLFVVSTSNRMQMVNNIPPEIKFLMIVPIRMQSGRLPTDENLYAMVDYLYNDYQNIMVVTAFEDKEEAIITQRLSSRIIGERFCWLSPLHPNTSTVGDFSETDQLLIYGDDLKKSVHNKITRIIDLRSILNLAAEEVACIQRHKLFETVVFAPKFSTSLHVKFTKASYILLDGIKSFWRNTTMWAKVDPSDEDTGEDSDVPSEPAGELSVNSTNCQSLFLQRTRLCCPENSAEQTDLWAITIAHDILSEENYSSKAFSDLLLNESYNSQKSRFA
ncbi:hypothetical protein CSKR_101498 [Clonorchis sinensis]|uniref:Uncharacterized protein n=1 Tax=Clonorchis sinensis TaxID=79923 RepID=A0A419PHA2_CLOSI|nr:hypothetical protein CSKR_101498 [Clonorchis sinensis]